jgi:ribosomal protein S18 acetylase RimI-like enzyme
MVELRLITEEDFAEIETWPPYEREFEQMDYALRHGGWLDEYANRAETWIYVAESDKQRVGFTLLSVTAGKEAEFRIAVHPQWTGMGFGRQIARAILKIGFLNLKMDRIYLIVRKNNYPAMELYESLGFKRTGESTHLIQGHPIEFFDMDVTMETLRVPLCRPDDDSCAYK